MSTVTFFRQSLSVLPILLLSFLYGCKVGYTQAATPIFNSSEARPFEVSESDISWMGSISYTGTLVSVIICFFLGNKIGRKVFITGSVVAYFIIWLVFYFAPSSVFIIAGLGFYGISASIHAIIGGVYIGEVASPQNREILGISYLLAMLTGIGLEFLISIFNSYRALIIFPLVVTVITGFLLITMKESPYFLIQKGKLNEARTIQAWLNNQTEEAVQPEFDKMTAYTQSQGQSRGQFSDMFQLQNLKILALMIVLNGSVLVNSGNVAQQYGQKVMEDFGEHVNLTIFVTIFNAISFVGAITSLFTIKLFGRKVLLLIGFFFVFLSQVCIAVSYFVESAYQNTLEALAYAIGALHCLTFFVSMASSGAGLAVLKTEIFPARLKEFFSALLAFTGDATGFVVVKTYVFLADTIGTAWVLIIYAIVNLFCVVLILIAVKDTKNKSLYEIQSEYSKKKKTDEE